MSQEDKFIPVSELVEDLRAGRVARRDFLRKVVAAGLSSAAAYLLLGQSQAGAQQVTTYAIGEETSPPWQSPPEQVTTQALGEESSPPQMTTQALGEESTPPPATTRAVGEESSPNPPMTTQVVGEESAPPQATTYAVGEESNSRPPTTLALGEESTAGRPSGYRRPWPSSRSTPSRWRNWYRW